MKQSEHRTLEDRISALVSEERSWLIDIGDGEGVMDGGK